MIDADVKWDEASMQAFENNIRKLALATRREVKQVVTQAAIFAIQSATKATKPGTSSKVSKMPQKFRKRPIKKMPADLLWYQYKSAGGPKIFKATRPIAERKNLRRVQRGLLAWGRKANAMIYRPLFNGSQPSERFRRIPRAGAAKAGWLGAYKRLGKIADTGGMDHFTTVQKTESTFGAEILITNRVRYAEKTSPGSAARGLQAAAARIAGTLKNTQRKLEGHKL